MSVFVVTTFKEDPAYAIASEITVNDDDHPYECEGGELSDTLEPLCLIPPGATAVWADIHNYAQSALAYCGAHGLVDPSEARSHELFATLEEAIARRDAINAEIPLD